MVWRVMVFWGISLLGFTSTVGAQQMGVDLWLGMPNSVVRNEHFGTEARNSLHAKLGLGIEFSYQSSGKKRPIGWCAGLGATVFDIDKDALLVEFGADAFNRDVNVGMLYFFGGMASSVKMFGGALYWNCALKPGFRIIDISRFTLSYSATSNRYTTVAYRPKNRLSTYVEGTTGFSYDPGSGVVIRVDLGQLVAPNTRIHYTYKAEGSRSMEGKTSLVQAFEYTSFRVGFWLDPHTFGE